MLSVTWFVVRTVQDLFRLTPLPSEVHAQQQQQKQPQSQQQLSQQQQQKQPQSQQQLNQQQQQQQTLSQQQQQQKQPQLQQQLTQQQQQQKQPQSQQQLSQQQPQQKHPQLQQQLSQQQQQEKQPQLQQQQNQQPQIQTNQQKLQLQSLTEVSKPNVARVQLSSQVSKVVPTVSADKTEPGRPGLSVSVDQLQAKTVTPQHTVPQQVDKSINPQIAETTPSVPNITAAESALQTSSRTLVLAPAASGGKMSFEWAQQQVEKFKFDFDQADKDKSGALSFQEVYDVLLNVGFKGTKEEAKFIFGHLDRDKDHKVTKEEFATAIKNLPRLSIKEFVLRKAFLKLDKDGSGYLSRSEIEDATKSEAGLDMAANKIADLLIYLAKEDKDGKVSYEEFLHVLGVESTATVMGQVFAKLDSDGSGYLTKEEILAAVKSEFELKLKAEKISDLLIYWCKDQDKKISYQEFLDVWLRQKGEK